MHTPAIPVEHAACGDTIRSNTAVLTVIGNDGADLTLETERGRFLTIPIDAIRRLGLAIDRPADRQHLPDAPGTLLVGPHGQALRAWGDRPWLFAPARPGPAEHVADHEVLARIGSPWRHAAPSGEARR